MTLEDLIVGAYGHSKRFQPDRIATETTELLRVGNRILRVMSIAAARVNPAFYGEQATVVFSAPGWARPVDAEAVFHIEDPTGAEVVVVPFKQRKAETELPAVYRWGRVYRGAGNTGDPTSGNLEFFYSQRLADLAAITDPVDATIDPYHELPELELAIYLALKDDSMAELVPGFVGERDRWLRLWIAFLEHETLNERRTYGQVQPFTTDTLVPLSTLLLGGTSVEV